MGHLRVVTDAPRTLVRRPPPRLSQVQLERLGAVLRNLHREYGTWAAVAAEMGVSRNTIHRALAGSRASMGLLVRAAELSNIAVERVLNGHLSAADICATCGQRFPQVRS